jgi:spore maturation protein CgeB
VVHADQNLERIYDVGFVGQVGSSYPERVRLLAALEQKYRLNDYRQKYYRADMARVYSQSKIVVNISHSNAIIPMRFFEAPAAGAMLLTQASATNGQGELLHDGSEYVSFSDVEDALDKVAHYLAHPQARAQIAKAGQEAVLAKHTYAQRAAQLLQTVQTDGLRRHAPARRWSEAQVSRTYLRAHSQLRLVDCVMEQKETPLFVRLGYALQALLRQIKHGR